MRVLILCNKVPYPANDGSSIAIRSMVEGLRQNGLFVCLMALNTLKHFKTKKEIKASAPPDILFESYNVNTNISAFGVLKNLVDGSPYHVSRFQQKNFKKALSDRLRMESFDVIQLEGLSMAVYLPLIRKTSRAKVVLRAHNIEHQIWERHIAAESSFLKKKYLKIQVKRLCTFETNTLKNTDANLFITADDLQNAKKLGVKNRSAAIPCGLNINEYAVNQKTTSFDICHLASFDWLPNTQGIEWFMEKVWPLVIQKRPNTSFALGGRHQPKSFLNFKERGVQLFSKVENSKTFIKKGKVVIVPLLAGSGMRIKLIENMALGCCLVSTSIGAEGINLEHGKEILLSDKPEDFANAIVYLLENEEERLKLQKAARLKIEDEYSNLSLGKQTKSFYQKL